MHLALALRTSLPAQVEIKVEPHLAFKLNGASFDSGARRPPRSRRPRPARFKLAMVDLDLKPYLGYVPASIPVRLTQGSVSADISVNLAVPPRARRASACKARRGEELPVTDASRRTAARVGRKLQLEMRDVHPLERQIALGTLRVESAQVHAVRDASGRINLLGLAAPNPATTPVPHGQRREQRRVQVPKQAPASHARCARTDRRGALLWNDSSRAALRQHCSSTA